MWHTKNVLLAGPRVYPTAVRRNDSSSHRIKSRTKFGPWRQCDVPEILPRILSSSTPTPPPPAAPKQVSLQAVQKAWDLGARDLERYNKLLFRSRGAGVSAGITRPAYVQKHTFSQKQKQQSSIRTLCLTIHGMSEIQVSKHQVRSDPEF